MKTFSLIALFVFVVVSGASAQTNQPPLPPPSNSAADLWRRVLAMTEQEREAFITSKPVTAQPYLRGKVREYLALTASERESRLVALELRATMLPLMKMSPKARAEHLQQLPERKRREFEQRLLTWDILPPPLKKDVLENETVVRLFVESQQSGASREQLLAEMSPQRREEMQRKLDEWDNMQVERQEQIFASVHRFFELDEKNRSRTLAALSDVDRAKLMPTLSAFDRMPKEQRELALDGFKRFKQLSPTDQQEFIRTAQRWEAMKEADKRLWRKIVGSLRNSALPTPPFPPGTLRPARVSTVGTEPQ
jgi:hypothetical protein